MRITTRLDKALLALEAVKRLAQHKFSAGQQQMAYNLNKLRRVLSAEEEQFQRQRKALIEELGTTRQATLAELLNGSDKEVSEIPRDSEVWLEFVKRLNALVAVAVELDCPTFKLADFDAVPLSADDVEALDLFFKESAEPLQLCK